MFWGCIGNVTFFEVVYFSIIIFYLEIYIVKNRNVKRKDKICKNFCLVLELLVMLLSLFVFFNYFLMIRFLKFSEYVFESNGFINIF